MVARTGNAFIYLGSISGKEKGEGRRISELAKSYFYGDNMSATLQCYILE